MANGWLQLELTRPWLLVGLVVFPALVYWHRRSLVDLPARQRLISLLFRGVIAALLVLALAGLTLSVPTTQQFVLFALDQSTSIGAESRAAAEKFVEEALAHAGEHRTAFLPFGAVPGQVSGDRVAAGTDGVQPIDPAGSDLAAALEVASAAIPPFHVPRIVLLSDGNETAGDVKKAALASGVKVFTVPLKTRRDPEIQLSAVGVPAQVATGEPFFVEVVVDANHDDEVTIEVFRGPHKVVGEKKSVKAGENRFRFRQSIDADRLAEFTARVSGGKDTLLDNNADSGLVFTAGKPRVLLVESDPKLGRPLAWALEEEGLQVDVRPPRGMPDSLSDLQNYEMVILSNVPATELSLRQMEVTRGYVQDLGGGFLMLGGDQSFGLGGYYKTLLEEILPVRSDFEKEKEKPSLAMVLVIDKSGSMGGDKIELAKDAAKGAVELLGKEDKIGVVAFEGETFWVSEIHPCSDKAFVIDRISTIEAGGGTDMYPAMQEAYDALQSTSAKLKHVIILTDGISAPGDFEGITQSMADSRMTVSTVAVGEGADQDLLEQIALTGHGRYYFTDDPSSVPQIFAKETVAASKAAINEQPFLPQVTRPTPALAGIDLDAAPFLFGYVITRPKPTSELVLATESGDPLLSWWRYGLGMSVAFTSDAKARWAAEWVTWPGYSKFWAQVVRQAMRKSETKGAVVEVAQRGGKATVTLDSVTPAGEYTSDAKVDLKVIAPGLETKSITLAQTAPGRYAGQFDTPRSGAYHLELCQTQNEQVTFRQSRGLAVGYPAELRLRPTNEPLLQSLSDLTGGRYDPAPASVFASLGETAFRALPLWPYLVLAATFLFLADVALRRIDFSLLLARRRRPAEPPRGG